MYCIDDGAILHDEVHTCSTIDEVALECLSLAIGFTREHAVMRSTERGSKLHVILGGWSYGGVLATRIARLISEKYFDEIKICGLMLFDSALTTPRKKGGNINENISKKSPLEDDTTSSTVRNHFIYCTSLLHGLYAGLNDGTCALPPLFCPILDIRASNTEYDSDKDAVQRMTSSEWYFSHEVEGTHWTLMFLPNVGVVGKIVKIFFQENF